MTRRQFIPLLGGGGLMTCSPGIADVVRQADPSSG